MEGIEPIRAIILEARALRELEPQISKAGFAFVKNGTSKKAVAFDVQYDFRRTFCRGKKLICLKTFDSRQGVEIVGLGDREHIVRDRVDAKLTLEEVLH